jgi:hypothetical protein
MDKDGASTMALAALIWILEQPDRANRLLDLTGLSPDRLRAGAGDFGLQAAVIGFLGGHEPDLVACAAAIGYEPEILIRAKDVLES